MPPECSKDEKGSQFKADVPYKFVLHGERMVYEEIVKDQRKHVQHLEIVMLNRIGTVGDDRISFVADGAGWFRVINGEFIFNLFSTGNTNRNLDPDKVANQLKKLTGMNVKYDYRSLSDK